MILKQLADLINSGLLSVFNFFDQKIFQPPQMDQVLQIPWHKDDEQLVIASHTSIISYDLLIQYELMPPFEKGHNHDHDENFGKF